MCNKLFNLSQHIVLDVYVRYCLLHCLLSVTSKDSSSTSLELSRSCPAQLAVLDNLQLCSRFLQGGESKEYIKTWCTRLSEASTNSSQVYASLSFN